MSGGLCCNVKSKLLRHGCGSTTMIRGKPSLFDDPVSTWDVSQLLGAKRRLEIRSQIFSVAHLSLSMKAYRCFFLLGVIGCYVTMLGNDGSYSHSSFVPNYDEATLVQNKIFYPIKPRSNVVLGHEITIIRAGQWKPSRCR